MLFFRQRNTLYFVYLARHVSTLEGHHQMLQIIYLQLLICNATFVLHKICVLFIINFTFGFNILIE
jgi:hypothetical protein